jgi:hypothetical protein
MPTWMAKFRRQCWPTDDAITAQAIDSKCSVVCRAYRVSSNSWQSCFGGNRLTGRQRSPKACEPPAMGFVPQWFDRLVRQTPQTAFGQCIINDQVCAGD